MELIQTVTVGAGGAASMELPGIPATFDDLALVVSARVTNVGIYEQDLAITFNGNTSNRISRRLFGNATSNGLSQSRTDLLIGQVVSALNSTPSFSKTSVYIPNYRLATAKSYSSDSGQVAFASADGNWANLMAGTWSDNAAITSIQISPSSGTFVQGTTASLYGIRSATGLAKATGGAISYDAVNNKVVHTFRASGTFTPTTNISGLEYLVVAGGGGGGADYAGGGGAGGLLYNSSFSAVSGTNYTVTVGAGGSGGTSGNARGGTGSNSVFASSTALGGGGGGCWPDAGTGASGGSGGGGAMGDVGIAGRDGGAATQGNSGGATGFGNAGGKGFRINGAPDYGGGGGGGAGQIGGDASSVIGGSGGKGGDGLAYSISGSSVIYAGGGGGMKEGAGSPGAGGAGGGGAGSKGFNVGPSTAGLANLGGGGGAGSTASTGYPGANGGSGIVIVRYSA